MTMSDQRVAELDDEHDYNDPNLIDYQGRLGPLRDSKGVARLRIGGHTGYMLLRYEDVRNGFFDNTRFSKSLALRDITFATMGPNIQGYDGDEHRIKRGLVSRAFRPRTVKDTIEPLIRQIAEELADELAPLGSTDLMTSFAKRYPLRIITQMLGIPREDEDSMAAWAHAMLRTMIDPQSARRANDEFTRYVGPLVEKRRAGPADDLLSTIVTEEIEGERLGDDEVFGFLRLLFPAGADTTWLTLGSLMIAVLEHPEVHQRLKDSEADRARAVEETVRWESVTGTEGRMTTQDVVCSGVEIPAGQLIWMSPAVANRDPLAFADPDSWNIDRPPRQHVGFGLGSHFCLGAYLARAELNIGLEVLLRRLPNLRMIERPPDHGNNAARTTDTTARLGCALSRIGHDDR
jgi:cytochrome P450